MTPKGSYLNARSPGYGTILKIVELLEGGWGVGGRSRPPRGGVGL